MRAESYPLPAAALEASFLPSSSDMSDDTLRPMELDELVSMLQEATSIEYWEQEDVELRPEDSGFLTAYCSKEQHTTIRATLTKLRQYVFEPIAFEVHELTASALDGRRTVLTEKEADARIAAAGAHPVYRGRTTINRQLLLESTHLKNHVRSIRTKASNGATAPDPIVATAACGKSLVVRATRTSGKALVVTLAGSGQSLDPVSDPREIRTTKDAKSAILPLSTARHVTFHGGARLQPGQSMLIGSSAPNGCTMLVRVRRLAPAADTQLGLLKVFPVRHLVHGADPGPNPRLPFEDARLFPETEETRMPPLCDQDRLAEILMTNVNPDSWDDAPNNLSFGLGDIIADADGETIQQLTKLLGELDAVESRQFSLEVRFGAIAYDPANAADAESTAKLAESLPTMCLATIATSRSVQLSATRHRQVVRDYDCVLAQGVSGMTPSVGPVTDGLLLRASIASMHQRYVQLDLNMTVMIDSNGLETLGLQHPAIGPIDRIAVREHKVRGSCPVELENWAILSSSPTADGKQMVIAARVHPL
ncbi:MAG: hypothetical protein AB8H80_10750 [Planctomycetota bacterium]